MDSQISKKSKFTFCYFLIFGAFLTHVALIYFYPNRKIYSFSKLTSDFKYRKNIWIIIDNYNCDDLDEYSFPKNWDIFSRLNGEIVNCQQYELYSNDFYFLEHAIRMNISKLGVFQTIPTDTLIWNDPYTLFINNKTSIQAQVCRNVHHSMTIETNDFPMNDWRIPFLIPEKLVPFNQQANLILEKSLLWVFPLLRDQENIESIFSYLSIHSIIRTIDVRRNMIHKNFPGKIRNDFDLPIEDFLANLTQTKIMKSTMTTLTNINFNWPNLKISTAKDYCSPVYWKQTGPMKIKDPDCHQIKVNFTGQAPMIEDIFLVIVFNSPIFKVIPYINNLFGKLFKHIGYCAPDKLPADFQGFFVGYKNYKPFRSGILNGVCGSVFLAMRHKSTNGMLVISDDMILNTHIVRELPKSNFLITKRNNGIRGTMWRELSKQITRAMDDLYSSKDIDLVKCANALNRDKNYRNSSVGGFADIYYVPYDLSRKFIKLNNFFIDRNVSFELGIPTLMYCSQTVDFFNTTQSGARERTKQWQIMDQFPKRVYIHPTKWGRLKKKLSDYVLRQHLYCRTKYFINDKTIQPKTMEYFLLNRDKYPLY